MSDFAPGFTGRIRVAEHVLQRAFDAAEPFAPSDVGAIGRRTPEPAAAPRHFSPAEPGAKPTEGWDPFNAEVQPGHGPFVDPIAAAHAAGVEEGRAAALAEVEAARQREQALLEQVSTALAQGAHFDRERMAGHLRQTVLHLVTRLVGEVGVSAEMLTSRVEGAIELLAESAESALLRLHPNDVAMVEGKLPATVFPVGDPNLSRGSFVVESASTIVEDGPDQWLAQLAQAIDRVPIPPLC